MTRAATASWVTGARPGRNDLDEQQPERHGHGQVGQRADRLQVGRLLVGAFGARHRAAVVELRAGDEKEVDHQVERIHQARPALTRLDAHQAEEEVADHAHEHAGHQQPERPAVPVDRAPQEHGGDPEKHHHAGERIGEGEDDARPSGPAGRRHPGAP